jgi:death on curing protein
MRDLTLGEVVALHRGFSLALNHPFVDGNKRAAHAAMEAFLLLNGFEIVGSVEEQERLMLDLAAGRLTREQLADWLEKHVAPLVPKDSAD